MTVQTDLYDAMLADVITLTNRPDLADETAIALRTATANAHLSDAYIRDLQTQLVQLPNSSYQVQLDIPTLFPRARGFSKVEPVDVNYQLVQLHPANQINVIEVSDIYDEYGSLRNNVAYAAGDKLNIRTAGNTYGFVISWWKAPSTRRTDYNSWIAQLYPDLILYWAASIVLDTNGNEAKAAKYMKMTIEVHLPFLRQNFLLSEQI